jgi:hypothetical protein
MLQRVADQPSGSPRRAAITTDLLLVSTLAAAVLVALIQALASPVSDDVGWLLFLSARVLDGGQLYREWLEINPPSIVWLGMPAVLVERWSGLHHATAFQIITAVVALSSVISCQRLARYAVPQQYRLPVAVAAAVALFLLPARDWGQREHLKR